MSTCATAGCDRSAHARDLCTRHYQRAKRHNQITTRRITRYRMDDLAMPPEERLAQVHDRVTPTPAPSDLVHLGDGNCWIWNLGKTRGGYGKVRAFGLYTVAHRWAYTLLVGPIPDGHQLDHLCGIPACVAPHHLEPVTPGENFDRARPAHAEAMRRRSARVREAAI